MTVTIMVRVDIDDDWLKRKNRNIADVTDDLERGADSGVRTKEGVLHVLTQTTHTTARA